MKLLAIETTGQQGTIVFSNAEQDLLSVPLPEHQRSTQSLVPTIRASMSEIGWTVDMLSHIAVAIGPGSFTGLRVGITTARMLAYVTGAKVIAVNTLQAMAARIAVRNEYREKTGINLVLATAMDAQRGDLSARFFQLVSGSIPTPITEIERIHFKDWWQKTTEFENILVASPMLGKVMEDKPVHVRVADPEDWFPSAEGVVQIAREKIRLNHYDDIWTIQPFYSRLSAAEEKKQNLASK